MNQSKTQSFVESVINTAIGFLVSFAAWPLVALISGVKYHGGQHILIVTIFTILSVARQYAIRRWCNKYLHKMAVWVARRLAGIKEPPVEYVVTQYRQINSFGRTAWECKVVSSDGFAASNIQPIEQDSYQYPEADVKYKAYLGAVNDIKAKRRLQEKTL
jgi:hypothetical protein